MLDLKEKSDEQLAREAARDGSDGPAFVELVERHRQRVWRLCYRLLGSEHDAQDATQEVFVRLFTNRGKFEGRSKFTSWLHGIAVNTCLSIRRARSRRQAHETLGPGEELPATEARQSAADSALSLDLYEMLETLDEEDRAMLILKYSEENTFEELAGLFDLSVSACKMRVSRAREHLRRRFEPAEENTAD